ncbi:hypothetical protein AB0F46_28015 [Streptomyces sp. NPDC026665]|uniref:hypothetical protein n=1 Tax=Streptomyces sp. NPDC026665 TaxID=3154798 RepID=UPI0033D6AC18
MSAGQAPRTSPDTEAGMPVLRAVSPSLTSALSLAARRGSERDTEGVAKSVAASFRSTAGVGVGNCDVAERAQFGA